MMSYYVCNILVFKSDFDFRMFKSRKIFYQRSQVFVWYLAMNTFFGRIIQDYEHGTRLRGVIWNVEYLQILFYLYQTMFWPGKAELENVPIATYTSFTEEWITKDHQFHPAKVFSEGSSCILNPIKHIL